MTERTSLLVVLALAVALIGLGLLWIPQHLPGESDWQIVGDDGVRVGGGTDAFAYAGGEGIQEVGGQAVLEYDINAATGTLDMTLMIESADPAHPLPFDADAEGGLLLHARLDPQVELWTGLPVCGDTGRGDSRLPEFHALLAAESEVSVSVGGRNVAESIPAFWSVGAAVRRANGSIGQQGLIYSPLLREKTGFSDPSRREMTLLLYGEAPNASAKRPVLLHLVYRAVTIASSPATATMP